MAVQRRWLLWVCVLCALACVCGLDLHAQSGGPATQPMTQPATLPSPLPGSGGLGSVPMGARVAVLPLKEAITMDVYTSLKYRIARAVQQGAQVIVVQIDSDAGDMDVARMIAEELRRAPVGTVAWIDRQALGPATIVVSACHEVVVGPGPVVGVLDAQASLKSGTAALVSDRLGPIFDALEAGASRSGIPYAFYEAMAVPGVEAYLVSHKRTGQEKVVNQSDYAVMVEGKDPDLVREAEIARVAGKYALIAPKNPHDKLKLPDGTEIDARSLGAVLSAEQGGGVGEIGQWNLVRQVHTGKVAWALTDPDIMTLGFAKGQAGSHADLQARYQASSVILIDKSWPESLAYWLISGPVRAALIILMVIGIFVELKMPGLMWGGGVAIACASVLVGAPFLVGLASFWHVLVFLLGIILLGVEVFILPGFGVVGVAGVALILLGLVLLIVPTGPGGGYNTVPAGLITRILISTSAWTLAGLVGGLAGLLVVLKFLPEIPGANRLILTQVQPSAGGVNAMEGEEAVGVPAGLPGADVPGHGRITVGSEGFAASGLRPAGLARFGEDTVDVMATTGWVEQGGRVRVTRVEGSRIYVEPVDSAVV